MDGKTCVIGVLALQGAFAKHQEMLEKLHVPTLQVKYPKDLAQCKGLIIPGGESTSMTYQMHERELLSPLLDFAKKKPIYGTCAGMVLMAKTGILSLLDISVNRNAYGSQCHSFTTMLEVSFAKRPIIAFFIRAPRIASIDSARVNILATYANEAVFVQQGMHLASAFHPELTNDLSIHQYFVELCTHVTHSPT